jgi:hypothetical protein
MKTPLGLPRNAAIALLAVVIVVFFMSMAFFIPWSHGDSGFSVSPSTSADAAAMPRQLPTPAATESTKETIELLKLVDPTQDAIHGDWVRDGDVLKNGHAAGTSQIEFPYVPPAEYDLRITFQCDQTKGSMAVICAAGGSQFVWRMEAGGAAGFALVGGRGFRGNRSTQHSIQWNHFGQPETLSFKFRRDHIDVLLDDQPATTFETDYQDLSLHPSFRQHRPDTLGIFATGVIVLQTVQVVEVTGHGTPTR